MLLILFSLHAGTQLEELAKAAGFDAVVSKTTPFPVVGIIEALKTRTSRAEAVPAPVADAVSSSPTQAIGSPVEIRSTDILGQRNENIQAKGMAEMQAAKVSLKTDKLDA